MTSNFAKTTRKIIGIAANSKKTFQRTGTLAPKIPIIFLKPSSSIIEEGDDIVLPNVFEKINFEVELGIIIGKKCKNIAPNEVHNYIGGYCLALDLTAMCEIVKSRAAGYPWDLGKGFDTATPVSRFIEVHEIKNRNDTNLWLKVNGEIKQNDSTNDLFVSIDDFISYVSKYMTLEENDLILTGTPDGCDSLKHGDIVECGIENLIQLKFNVRKE